MPMVMVGGVGGEETVSAGFAAWPAALLCYVEVEMSSITCCVLSVAVHVYFLALARVHPAGFPSASARFTTSYYFSRTGEGLTRAVRRPRERQR